MNELLIAKQRKPMTVILLLFALSLPLSKSAVTVLVGIAALYLLSLVIAKGAYRAELKHLLVQPLLVPVLLPVGVALGGLFLTTHLSDGLGIVNKLATLPLAYLVTSVLTDATDSGPGGYRTAETALLVFIAGIFLLDSVAVLTYLGVIGQRKFTLPMYPMNVHHIWFANLNAVGIYAASSFLFFRTAPQEPRKNTLLPVFIVLAIVSILFSIARTAWFAMFATGVVLTYLYVDRKRIFLLALAVLISGCFLAYSSIPFVHDRVNAIYSDIVTYNATGGDAYSSLGDRFLMWKAAIKMFSTNPVLGVGTGEYVETIKAYVSAGLLPSRMLGYNQPHNMYLFSLASNGVLGLGALLFMFYRVFAVTRSFRRVPPREKQLFFIAIAVAIHYLFAGMTDSLFNIFILRYAFAFIMGLCVRESVLFASQSR